MIFSKKFSYIYHFTSTMANYAIISNLNLELQPKNIVLHPVELFETAGFVKSIQFSCIPFNYIPISNVSVFTLSFVITLFILLLRRYRN